MTPTFSLSDRKACDFLTHLVMICALRCRSSRVPESWPQAVVCLLLRDFLPGNWKVCCCCSVQSLTGVWLFVTPWTAAHQASLSITNSQSLPKLMSTESVMPSSHLILCYPLLLPSIFPSIRVFSNESALHIRWLKYWSFSFNISPSNE